MVNIRTSRSWIEVDLDAITHNLDELSSLLNKNSSLMVVVKAEGYGHGLVEVAKHCQKMGIEALQLLLSMKVSNFENMGYMAKF